jgi:hypothetical protein
LKDEMKSFDTLVQSLYDGILTDIGVKYPELRKELSRDFVRLSSGVKSNGISFFTIILPEAGKHFDKCLSQSHLTPFRVLHFGVKKRGGVIPRLFGKLLLRVFDINGVLRVDADVYAIKALRQLFYAAKSLKLECTDARTYREIEKFFEVDRGIRHPTLSWGDDELGAEGAQALSVTDIISDVSSPDDPVLPFLEEVTDDSGESLSPSMRRHLYLLQKVADHMSALIGVFDPYAWKAKHGPGAVSDSRSGKSKYDFPNWPRKLDLTFPMADFGFANFSLWIDAVSEEDIVDRFSVHEPPSKLISVPKTARAPRLIASEPIAHQWCQQVILDFLTSRVDSTFMRKSIHFRDQTYNQRAALLASHTDKQMTIDLSSASDRISCWLIERLFRRNESLLRGLHASRTRWIVNTVDKKSPSAYLLRKFSCMGSACTFPVQTIVFWMIAVASVLSARRLRPSYGNISDISGEVLVFGDDIIIPNDAGECLELLRILGLKVNHNKTFLKGKFRESCGCDAFDGHDVTPIHVISAPDKARPESITSAVESVNNLVRGGWPNAAHRVKTTVMSAMPHLRLATLPVDSGYYGWKTPYWMDDTPAPKRRWNALLHRVEVLVHTLVSKSKTLPDRGGSRILQFFTEAPPSDLEWVSGVRARPKSHLRLRWEPYCR